MDSEGIKDQIIKNLKGQIEEGYSKIQDLEKQITDVEFKNQEFIERIQDLTYKNHDIKDEDEESYKFETLESLRDEIAMVEQDFCLSNRQSLRHLKVVKEIGTQADDLKKRKKKRFSCFSLFD